MSLHKEIHLKQEICEHLGAHGWVYEEGVSAQYDRVRALFAEDVIAWVQESQPEAWQALVKGPALSPQKAPWGTLARGRGRAGNPCFLGKGGGNAPGGGKKRGGRFSPPI